LIANIAGFCLSFIDNTSSLIIFLLQKILAKQEFEGVKQALSIHKKRAG